MLELSSLKFSVDTTELVEAKRRIEDLIAAQQRLGAGPGGTNPASKHSGGNKAVKEQVGLLEKLDYLYGDLAEGMTRWEASQLRAARALGIPLEEVLERLTKIRKLTNDPFDSAIGSVRSITQHFEELQNRIALTNEGIAFTTKQLREFSRIPFEIEGQIRSAGMNPQEGQGLIEFQKRVQEAEQQYIQTAKRVNELAGAEKQRIDTVKQAAAAEKFLATEMQRVDSILAELNREHADGSMLSERHAASIARFSNQLKMAGVSGTQATAQLESYRQKMQQIEALENRRAQNRLANALAPQISDVAVSLAGGMPLHLVIMQQGLQIRDLIGQSGVAAEHLQKTMREAMKNMVTSIGGTVAALAQMTGGALMDAGKGMSNFVLQISGVTAGLERLRYNLTLKGFAGDEVAGALAKGLAKIPTLAAVAAGALTGGLVVGLSAVVYETIKLIGANNDLARSLAVTGNVFGVTYGSSISYVEGLTKVGASTRDAMEIIREMSKTSHLTVKDLDMVGTAAIRMQDYAGVAIEDTIKAFNDMAKDPVKALTELAIKTGDVAPEVTKLVRELAEQGRVADATGIAMRALADQQKVAVDRMIADLHPLTKAWIDFKKFFGEMYAEMGVAIQRATSSLPERQKIQDQIKDNLSVLPIFRTKAQDEELKQLQQRLVMLDKVEQSEVDRAQTRSKAEKEAQKAAELSLQYTDKAAQKNKALAQLEKDRAFLIKQGSPMSEAAYNEQLKKIEDQFKDKDVGKAAAAAARYEKSAIEKLNDAYNKTVSKARELSDIEKAMLDIRDDPDYLKRNAAGRKEIEDYAIQLHKKAEAEALVKKEQDFTKDSLSKLNEAYSKSIGAVKNLTEVERDWLRVQGEAGFVQLSTERKNALEAEANALIARTKAILDSKKAIEHGTEMRSLGIQREDIAFRSSLLGVPEEEARKRQAAYDLQKREEQNLFEYAQELKRIQDSSDAAYSEAERRRAREKWLEKNQLAKENYELETQALTDMQKRQQAFDGIVKRGFEQMGDSLIDFALTGKSSFGDMIQSMLVDLAKLEMRMQMMKWYESMGGGSGGGGILSGLLSLLPSFDGGGSTGSGPRVGGLDGKGGSLAIVHPNETILDHTRGQRLPYASGSSTKVDVVIINNSGAQVKQQETVDSRGNRKVEVVVGEMASGEVQRSGSAMQRGIGSTFGMRPALIAR